jgi:proteasome-associated ATPase
MKHADAAITGDTDLDALEIMFAEGKLNAANRRLGQALDRNEALAGALAEARSQIASLSDEIEKLCAPPSTYGVYLSSNPDGTLNALAHGRKVKVTLRPGLTLQERRGRSLARGGAGHRL